MAKGLYVLCEGLPSHVIDSQVIEHLSLLREHLSIEFDLLVLAPSKSLYDDAVKRLPDVRKRLAGKVSVVKGFRPALPWSRWLNERVILRQVADLREYDFVHARTDYTAAMMMGACRRLAIPILWDCRGDALAEIEGRFSQAFFFAKPFIAWRKLQCRRNTRLAASGCSAATFVTASLRDVNAKFGKSLKTWLTPCFAPEDFFFFDQAVRAETRAALGYKDEQRVYVYSGGMAAYQCFSSVVKQFEAIYSKNDKARLLVLTSSVEYALRESSRLPEEIVKVMSVSFFSVGSYLCASDFAFFLREEGGLNEAAFPTKFAEYAMTGLPIIMNESPRDCARLARKWGIFSCSKGEGSKLTREQREECSSSAAKELGRRQSMVLYSYIYNFLLSSKSGAIHCIGTE